METNGLPNPTPKPAMKHTLTTTKVAGALTALALSFVPGSALFAQGNSNKPKIPAVPSGWLTAYPTMVQAGTHPTLNWSISYPSEVLEFIEINSPATLKTKEKIDVCVRVLGNGVTAHNSSTGEFISWVDAGGYISYDGGGYENVFLDTNRKVNPNKVVWSKKNIPKGKKIRFGGQYHWRGSTGPFRHSEGGTQHVRTLVHGDIPPTSEPMHLAPTLEDFIRPYLDSSGRVNIGPLDVIVFMELTHGDHQQDDQGYDLQDLVLLCTFKADKPKNNNGHGNNLDGVDMSNPGNAPFMQYDSDPNFDDESGGGGAYPSN